MDEKNFRSQYYKKVGLREVEEKRHIECLLKEQPLDESKLVSFCQRSSVPANYRALVWKLLLGITPCYAESHEYVRQQQTLMFNELWYGIKVLGFGMQLKESPCAGASKYVTSEKKKALIDAQTTPEAEHYLLMWMLGEARLSFHPLQQLETRESKCCILIAKKIITFFDDPIDIYQVCSNLWPRLLESERTIEICIQDAIGILCKDHESLYIRLDQAGLFRSNLLQDYCLSLFCDILPDFAIEKLLDKIIAGAFRILTYLIVALLTKCPLSVLSVDGVKSVLGQIRKEEAEIVVTSAIDQWHRIVSLKTLQY